MKKFHLLILLSSFLLSSFYSSAEWRQQIDLQNGRTEFTVKKESGQNFSASLGLHQVKLHEVSTPLGPFIQVTAEGFVHSKDLGLPALPQFNKLIEIPYGANYTIEILHADYDEFDLTNLGATGKIIPAQLSVSKSDDPETLPFHYNIEHYQTNQLFENELISIQNLGMMRGVQLGRISIHPFAYNPVTNLLRIYKNISFRVVFNGGDRQTMNSEKSRTYSPYYQNVFSRLLNYDHPVKELIELAPPSYVIVSPRMFDTQLQDFIYWKTRKGFRVIEAYTDDPAVGTTTTSIKAYLKNLYTSATAANPAPSFVLLVGDIAQIPVFSGTAGSHVTDLYYFTYDVGSDIYPEIYYGRMSATNVAQLRPQLDKTLEYEQFAFDDASFLDEVVLVAGVDASYAPTYGNGQVNYGTSNYFNLQHGIEAHTYLYPVSGSSGAAIKQKVSNGVSLANYTAHCNENGWGDPSFVVNDVAALQNTSKYPLMIGNCCLSAKFDVNVCFAEAVLRAENKGALGYIGGSNNTYWNEDFWYSVGSGSVSANPTYAQTGLGFYDRMWHDNGEPESAWFVTNGQIVQAGNMAVTEAAGMEVYYWEIYHLLGDPSVTIYLGIPPALSANHTNGLPVGSTSITIQTEENAYFAITADSVLISSGIADASGILTLSFNPVSSSPLMLVGTKQNREPYFGEISVFASNTPFVVASSSTINDQNGNGNALADYEEAISLNLLLNNLGMLTASNLTLVLSTNDPAVTITNNTIQLDSIPSQQTHDLSNAFGITIGSTVADQHIILFTLTVSDNNGNVWESFLSITVQAPKLSIHSVSFHDQNTGNGNSKVENGEVIELSYTITNQGHAPIGDFISLAQSNLSQIQFVNHQQNISGLGISQSLEFTTLALINLQNGIAEIEFLANAEYYSTTNAVQIPVGQISEDWETQNFNQFNWENTSAVPWLINNSNSVNTTLSARSGDITDSQSTTLTITSEAAANDSIHFDFYVSSEPAGWNYYDYLEFFIDNVSKGKWAGQVNWTKASFPVSAGTHTYKWTYKKDSYLTEGEDLARIDNIVFPISIDFLNNHAPVVTSSADTLVEVGGTYNYSFTSNDADGDVLSLLNSGIPAFLTVTDLGNGNAELSGSPTSADKGIYNLILSVWDGFAFGSQIIQLHVVPNASISKFEESEIYLFPNPAKDQLQISIDSNLLPASIKLLNSLGMELQSSIQFMPQSAGISKINLNIEELPAGVYFIELESDRQKLTQKFIKY